MAHNLKNIRKDFFMIIYLLKATNKFLHKNKVKIKNIFKAVEEIQSGNYDAHLGNGLYKQQLPANDKGKLGGYRVIIIINNNVFIPYIYPKSEQDNISDSDLAALKKMAKDFAKLTEKDIEKAIKNKTFIKLEKPKEQ